MKEHFRRNAQQYRLLALLAILLAVMGFLAPGKFLTVRNFKNMGLAASMLNTTKKML